MCVNEAWDAWMRPEMRERDKRCRILRVCVSQRHGVINDHRFRIANPWRHASASCQNNGLTENVNFKFTCRREVIDDPLTDVNIKFIHIRIILYVQCPKGHWWPFDSCTLKDFCGKINVMLSCRTVSFCQLYLVNYQNLSGWRLLIKHSSIKRQKFS
jgi:hypothetical protein